MRARLQRFVHAAATAAVWLAAFSPNTGAFSAEIPGPSAVHPHGGPQAREEVFEFAEGPAVSKDGDRWAITFTSKGRCDATVAVVDANGRIVRHLASGVLGENAPPPFRRDSLAQRIEWDGKDDHGRPAALRDARGRPAGCRIRVSLGLKAGFGMSVGQSPHMFSHISGIACDGEGNLYVAEPPPPRMPVTLRVFSRDGKYLRTISPPPGGLKADEYAGFDVIGPKDNPFFVPKTNAAIGKREPVMGMAVSSNGRVVFSNSGYRIKKHLTLVRRDGANLRHGSQLGPWQLATGPAFLAFTQNEREVYVSGLAGGQMVRKGVYHCVFRFALEQTAPKEWSKHNWAGKAPVFVGNLEQAGDDDAHLNMPRGVAADAEGNVYVCDFLNDRVQVFSAGAKLLRTIPADRPDQIAVHRKTGAIYVLVPNRTRVDSKRFPKARVIKFSADGKRRSAFEFPGCCAWNPGFITVMALDDSAEPPIIWLANTHEPGPHTGQGLWRVADRGGRFEKLGDIRPASAWRPITAPYNGFITVDPDERLLYIKRQAKHIRDPKGIERIDLRTGKPDAAWQMPVVAQPVDEVLVGGNGLLYARGCILDRFDGNKPECVWRIDLATGKEVPFPAARHGRIQFPGDFTGNFQRRGFCVAPNGDVYVIVFHKNRYTLNHYSADGRLVREDLIPGIPPGSCTVRVDRAGNIYAALNVKPAGKGYPEILTGLRKDGVLDRMFARIGGSAEKAGTLLKFSPRGGRITTDGGDWIVHKAAGVPYRGSVEGHTAGYCGIDPFGTGCTCPSNRHELDGFARVFVPHTHLSCVLVLDSNLNRITRIGNYGNVDNAGPRSSRPTPEIGLASPNYVAVADRALYIADQGNKRIVRADLRYHAEREAKGKLVLPSVQ